EQRFDGAGFQYSTDGGNNWNLLGDINSNSNCSGTNWYNTSSITYLGNIGGWTGNVQPNSGSCLGGNGSGAWLTARHTLSMLAGQTNVRFRFLFGAGTTCNAFNGFAIDDIFIAEAAANSNTITKSCVSTTRLQFGSAANCVRSYAWNFGDPASGSSNNATSANPTHDFSGPGNYTVTLITNYVSGPPSTSTTAVSIIGLTNGINWPGACTNSPDATLTVTANGSNGPYFYSWNSNPSPTNSISNVGAGTYTVTVNAVDACSASSTFVLTASGAVNITETITNAACAGNNGAIQVNVSGGAAPYSYTWSNGASGAAINNLAPGTYSLSIADGNGCISQAGPFTIINENKTLSPNLGADIGICPGQTVVLNAGVFAAYTWQDGSSGSTFTLNRAGKYYVTVADAQGCSGSDTLNVIADCSDIYFPAAFTPNNDTRNDLFGPLGNLGSLQNYSLHIFDRYGNRVFFSRDPFEKWNGRYKGANPETGVFVWMSSFILNGRPQSRKGTITLIR
ncbi:MAG: T9SS type B sorting domain-containing protein, partial [Sphingobacteriales bacterium]